jgi:hypothetical protein
MKRRITILAVSALVVLGAFITGAALTSGCPSGWHELASGGCLTDSTHLAPSSEVRIPDAMMLQRDPRWGLRAGILGVGVLLTGGILWVGLKDGRPRLQEPVTAAGDEAIRSFPR